MKVFRIESDGKPIFFYRISDLRAYLKTHPDIQTVTRDWWYQHDLIECEDFSRDEILRTKAKKLTQGQTAQWAQPRTVTKTVTRQMDVARKKAD